MGAITGEERERVARALGEFQQMLGSLVGLLDEYDRLRQGLEEAERDRARLREEVGELRDELEGERSARRAVAETLSRSIESLAQVRARL
jgi:predicted  nucleic acid-binding Zn-ribbon protein